MGPWPNVSLSHSHQALGMCGLSAASKPHFGRQVLSAGRSTSKGPEELSQKL